MGYNAWGSDSEFENELLAATANTTNTIDNLSAGIRQDKAQKEYNELQRELTRETNESNERINQRNLEYQKWALESQQNYQSFANQIAMARAAGVNPYTVYNGNTVTGGSSGTPASHPMQSPQGMVVEDGFAQSLRQKAQMDISNIVNLASARKDDAEGVAQELRNYWLQDEIVKDLQLKGENVKAQQIENEFNAANNPLRLANQWLQNENMMRQNDLADLEKQIKTYMRDNIQPQEFANLLQTFENLQLQGKVYITQADLNKANAYHAIKTADAQSVIAAVNSYLAKSQERLNNAMASDHESSAKLKNAIEQHQLNENAIYRVYGAMTADANLRLLNGKANISEEELKGVYSKNEMLRQEMDFVTFDHIARAVLPMGLFQNIFGGAKPVAPAPKSAAPVAEPITNGLIVNGYRVH